jgi:hypothetical protein
MHAPYGGASTRPGLAPTEVQCAWFDHALLHGTTDAHRGLSPTLQAL